MTEECANGCDGRKPSDESSQFSSPPPSACAFLFVMCFIKMMIHLGQEKSTVPILEASLTEQCCVPSLKKGASFLENESDCQRHFLNKVVSYP